MDATRTDRTSVATVREFARINWNGEPFIVLEPPFRSTKVVRTKLVTAEQRRRYCRTGWPRELVLMREHSLKLRGEDMTIKLVTNADEAEDELPDSITTYLRDTGTYRDARVVWRGRPVAAFVSVRLSPLVEAESVQEAAQEFPPDVLARIVAVLGGGVMVPQAPLVDGLSEDERILLNLLIARPRGQADGCYALRQIGEVLGVSDEGVRRRRTALLQRHPNLASVIARFRSRHARGEPLEGLREAMDAHEEADDE